MNNYSLDTIVQAELKNPNLVLGTVIAAAGDIIEKVLKTNIEIPYCLNSEQKATLSRFFNGHIQEVGTQHADHPVMAVTYSYFNREIKNTVGKNTKVLLLGSSYKELRSFKEDKTTEHVRAVAVFGIQDARDYARLHDGYLAALQDLSKPEIAALAREYIKFYKHLTEEQTIVDSPHFLTKYTYKKSKEKFDLAVAMESLYDMSPLDVWNYFDHFGLKKCIATFLTCIELTQADSFDDLDFGMTFRRVSGGRIACIHHGSSNGYVHHEKTFYFWNLKSWFAHKDKAIYLERTKCFGAHTSINIYMVPNINNYLVRTLPSHSDTWVQLFDPIPWIRNREKHYFWVLKEKFYSIYYFGERQAAEQFDPTKLFTYAHGKINMLSIAGNVINISWSADPWTVDKTVQFAMMLAVFRKGETFRLLSDALKSSKKKGELVDLLPHPLIAWFRRQWEKMVDNPVGELFSLSRQTVLEALEGSIKSERPTEMLLIRGPKGCYSVEDLPDPVDSTPPELKVREPPKLTPKRSSLKQIVDKTNHKFDAFYESPTSSNAASWRTVDTEIYQKLKSRMPVQVINAETATVDEEVTSWANASASTSVKGSIDLSSLRSMLTPELKIEPRKLTLSLTKDVSVPIANKMSLSLTKDVPIPAAIEPSAPFIPEVATERAHFTLPKILLDGTVPVPPPAFNPDVTPEHTLKDPRLERRKLDAMRFQLDEQLKNQAETESTEDDLLHRLKKVIPEEEVWTPDNQMDEILNNFQKREPLEIPIIAKPKVNKRSNGTWGSDASEELDQLKPFVRNRLFCKKYEKIDVANLDTVTEECPIDLSNAKAVLQKYLATVRHARDLETLGALAELAAVHNDMAKLIRKAIGICDYKINKQQPILKINCTLWDCKAGAGKTTAMFENFDYMHDAYIISTNTGRIAFNDRCEHKWPKVNDFPVWTFETGMTKKVLPGRKRLFVDEAFTLPMAYFYTLFILNPSIQFVLGGDLNQCLYHSTNSPVHLDTIYDHINIFKRILSKRDTKRFSQNVCDVINAVVPEYQIYSTSKNVTKIGFVSYEQLIKKGLPMADLNIAPSSKTAVAKDALTVRSAQGLDAKTVNLLIGSNDLFMMQSPEIFIVSMSRAITQLNIVEVKPGVAKALPFDFEAAADFIQPVYTSDNEALLGNAQIDTTTVPMTKLDHSSSFNASIMESIMMQLPVDVMDISNVEVPDNAKLVYKVNPDELTSTNVYKCAALGQNFRGRLFRVSSSKQCIRTFLSRASVKNRMKFSPQHLKAVKDKFKKMYMNEGYDLINPSTMWNAAASDIVEKYKTTPYAKNFSIEPSTSISGHLKTIIKVYVNDLEKLTSSKAGQSISAWDSTWSVIFGPYMRTMAAMLQKNLKPNFVYANGLTEAELHAKTQMLIATVAGQRCSIQANDFTQYDASQGSTNNKDISSIDLEEEIVREVLGLFFGENDWALDLFFVLKRSMKIYAGSLQINNDQQNTSGNAGTFLFNTVLQMIIWCLVLNNKEMLAGMFGGDDSLQWLTVTTAELARRLLSLNITLKTQIPSIPIFFNHFLNPLNGHMVADPLRLAWSLFSKNFGRQTEAEEIAYIKDIQLAIADKMLSVRNSPEFVHDALEYHYEMTGFNINILLEQLGAFVKCPPEVVRKQLTRFDYTI